MKKVFLNTLIAAIVCTFTLTGCFKSTTSNQPEQNQPTQNQTTQNQTEQNNNTTEQTTTKKEDLSKLENPENLGSDELLDYGQRVTVKGKQMNTYTVGNGKERIVWLPGYGAPSPVLSYINTLKQLKDKYTITVVEPFGYGLSDTIGTPRTLDNIVEEVHDAIKQVVGDDKYYLMSHSISGIYSLKYANVYTNELLGLIGIDTSTPNMYEGFNFVYPQPKPEDLDLDDNKIDDVSDSVNREFGKIAKKVFANEDSVSEATLMTDNLKESEKYSIPKNIPTLFLLASESVEDKKTGPSTAKDWVKSHNDLAKDNIYLKTVVIDGEHDLYNEKYKEIAKEIKEFTDEADKKNSENK